MKDKSKSKDKKKDTVKEKSNGMVVIPYIQGVSERIQRVFIKHNIATAMRPYNTLKNNLVHPKDKRETAQTCDCIYEIPCKNCNKSYVGKTGTAFGTRLKEHMKDAEKVNSRRYTWASKKDSVEEVHKSAVTDHIAEQNHVIDWEGAKIVEKDSNKQTRWIRDAIWIRKRGPKSLIAMKEYTL